MVSVSIHYAFGNVHLIRKVSFFFMHTFAQMQFQGIPVQWYAELASPEVFQGIPGEWRAEFVHKRTPSEVFKYQRWPCHTPNQ